MVLGFIVGLASRAQGNNLIGGDHRVIPAHIRQGRRSDQCGTVSAGSSLHVRAGFVQAFEGAFRHGIIPASTRRETSRKRSRSTRSVHPCAQGRDSRCSQPVTPCWVHPCTRGQGEWVYGRHYIRQGSSLRAWAGVHGRRSRARYPGVIPAREGRSRSRYTPLSSATDHPCTCRGHPKPSLRSMGRGHPCARAGGSTASAVRLVPWFIPGRGLGAPRLLHEHRRHGSSLRAGRDLTIWRSRARPGVHPCEPEQGASKRFKILSVMGSSPPVWQGETINYVSMAPCGSSLPVRQGR